MRANFGWLDATIILAYLLTLAGIGVYFSRRQKNLEDFFLAGRSMGWVPVGMSLMAALNSGIDYLMEPFKVFTYGLIFIFSAVSWVFLYPWVAYVTLPFYRRLNVYSAYEYLEARFDSSVRTLGASIFLLWRLGWMATAIYVPSLAISATTGLSLGVTIVVLGGMVTLYTTLGGITAIIWTDVLQFCVMLAGVAITLGVVIANVPGGVAGIWEFAQASGKTQLLSPVPAEAGTFVEQLGFWLTDYRSIVGITLAVMVGRMTHFTCEQSMVQRFQAARSLQDSRQAFIVNAFGDAFWTLGLAFVGLSLFAYFRGNLPPGVQADALTIHFMREVFPTGLNGLVVAAVLASGLSAIDAAINAGTSVIMIDFYNRLILKRPAAAQLTEAEGRAQVRISRIVTVLFAILGMILAANVARLGNLVEIANKAIQTFTGPLFGLFLLGMFSTRARARGVFIGGLLGLVTSLFIAFGTRIGFIWPTVFGLAATLLVGYVASLLMQRAAEDQSVLTWKKCDAAAAERDEDEQTPYELIELMIACVPIVRRQVFTLLLALSEVGGAMEVGRRNEAIPTAEYSQLHYVAAASGSDAEGDGSAGKPWATVARALERIADAGESKRQAVLVGAGVYREPTIQMKPYVDLFGGFEPARWQRDIFAHATTLDGEQSRRVLIGADHARLDGFTIRGGKVAGPGAGILTDRTSPAITNNVFTGNMTLPPADYVFGILHQVGSDGGAIACLNGARPAITNNAIIGNSTGIGGGAGIACRNYSTPTIANNVICDNVTGLHDIDPDKKKRARSSNGAAISCSNAPFQGGEKRMMISRNVIINNRAGGNSDAGGVYCEYDSSPDIAHNYLLGNAAEDDGGAIYVMKSSQPLIAANIIAGSTGGGAVRLSKEGRARIENNLLFANAHGDVNCVGSWMILCNNTIIPNSGAGIIYENHSAHLRASIAFNNIIHGKSEVGIIARARQEPPLLVSHSNVQGACPGAGNLDADPLFIDDGQSGLVSSADHHASRAQTTLSLLQPLREAGQLQGRVVRVVAKWGVIQSVAEQTMVVWGDLRPAAAEKSMSLEVFPTYRLRADSPCIDRGTGTDAPATDIDGDERPRDAVDIGADERTLETRP